MRKLINHEHLRKEWVLEKWYEKTIYVLGYIIIAIYVLAFTFGLLAGFFNSLNQ